MHIAVLGAGVVGITTAWYLQKQGHQVTVVDRQNQSGLETSYANGGQISVSHAEPWANPSGAPESGEMAVSTKCTTAIPAKAGPLSVALGAVIPWSVHFR